MEDHTELIESLFIQAEDYGDTNIKLTRLQTAQVTTNVLSLLAARAVVGVTASMFLLILTLGIAMWLGKLFGQIYYGFFAVAGFYALLALLFYSFLYKWIRKPIAELVNGAALNAPSMTEETINDSINQLEIQKKEQKKNLKQLFHQTFESLKPVNMVRNAIHTIATSQEIKSEAVTAAAGLAAGRMAKKIVTGNSNDPLRNMAGAFLESSVVDIVAKNPEKVEISLKFLKLLLGGNHRSAAKQPRKEE